MPLPSSIDDRRRFLQGALTAGSALLLPGLVRAGWVLPRANPFELSNLFEISLAQWSLHQALHKGEFDNLGFPQVAKELGFLAIEYVNSFWKDKATDAAYLTELKKRCADLGVTSVLIMCDGEGALGDPDAQARQQAVNNHHRWVDAATALGCKAIRVNAQSRGSFEEQQKLAADGLRSLCEYGDKAGIDVIVENHGGLSSNGKWLAGTLKLAGHPRCGALPDFGNFNISATESYDRYLGVDELMPFARGVSAKSHDFNEQGNEIHTDFRRMLEVVVDKHGYRGHIGVEYEGKKLPEREGAKATRVLLERCRDELTKKLASKPGTAGDGK
jgi:L-ribulose-5-phosphate 3-epimerase